MRQLLVEGLAPFGLHVQEFKLQYLSIQTDDIKCGQWTATTVEALANGMSLGEHILSISPLDEEKMVKHHKQMLMSNQNIGVYQRVNPIDDEKEYVFLESNHDQIIRKFRETMHYRAQAFAEKLRGSFHHSDQLLDMLIARESINFNGAKLTPEIFDEFKLAHQEISEQQNMIGCLLRKAAENEDGYSIRHQNRIIPKLYSIGLSELEIAAMDFKTILKYDEYSLNTHKSEFFRSDRKDTTGILLSIKEASKDFNQVMYSYFATTIRADIVREDIERRARAAQRSEEVTVNFDVAVLTNAMVTENKRNPEPSNYTFLMNILASPITKGIAVVILLASFILLGVVTAGISTIPIAVGIAGVCSGAILLGGSLWASKRMQQDPENVPKTQHH